MKINKILSLVAIMLFVINQANAQVNIGMDTGTSTSYYGKLSWNMALPVGKSSNYNYINSFSVRGTELEFGKYINSHLSVGASIGWNVFYDNLGFGTYNYNGMTVTGDAFNYVNSVPMMVKANYYFRDISNTGFVPYLSLGVGTTFQKHVVDISYLQFTNKGWMATIAPEVGGIYNITSVSAVSFAVRYSESFKTNKIDALEFVGFNFSYIFSF